MLRKRPIILLIALVILAAWGHAAPIVLDTPDLLGTVSPSSPNKDVNHAVQVNFLVNAYNAGTAEGTNLGDNPLDPKTEQYILYRPDNAPAQLSSAVMSTRKDTNSSVIDLAGMTYEYVLYKQAHNAWIYYIGDLPGDVSIQWGGGSTISHWVLFNGRPYTPPPPPVYVAEAGNISAAVASALLLLGLVAKMGENRRRSKR